MNVFEDLIVELKQENLLEDTVIDDQLEQNRLMRAARQREKAEIPVPTEDHRTETAPSDARANELQAEMASIAVLSSSVAEEALEREPEKPIKVRPGKEFFRK